MARRKRKNANIVSLFPFLSILACVIGTLTLMITAMALGQLDPQAVAKAERELVEAKKRAQRYAQLVRSDKERSDQIAQLQKRIDEAQKLNDQLNKNRQQLEQLQVRLKRIKRQSGEVAKRLEEAERLKLRIQTFQQQYHKQQEKIKQLKQQLEEKQSLRKPRVSIRASGSGVNMQPAFIELDNPHVIIHSSDPPVRIHQKDIGNSSELAKVFSRTAKRRKGVAVLLVRPNSIGLIRPMRNQAWKYKCQVGKLPVLGEGKIDLSHFEGK